MNLVIVYCEDSFGCFLQHENWKILGQERKGKGKPLIENSERGPSWNREQDRIQKNTQAEPNPRSFLCGQSFIIGQEWRPPRLRSLRLPIQLAALAWAQHSPTVFVCYFLPCTSVPLFTETVVRSVHTAVDLHILCFWKVVLTRLMKDIKRVPNAKTSTFTFKMFLNQECSTNARKFQLCPTYGREQKQSITVTSQFIQTGCTVYAWAIWAVITKPQHMLVKNRVVYCEVNSNN